MHEKYVGLKKSYSEQEMVGIKNVLPLFLCHKLCITGPGSGHFNWACAKSQTTDIAYRRLFRDHGNVAYGQIQIENYKVVFFGDLLVYEINSLYTF